MPSSISIEQSDVLRLAANYLDKIHHWIAERTWSRRSFFAATTLLALAIFLAWPNFSHFTNWHERWWEQAMEWKIDHPLAPIPVEAFVEPGGDTAGTVSHLQKRTYRVTMPLAAHALGLRMRGAEVLGMIAGAGFVFILVFAFRRLCPDEPAVAVLLSAALGCSFVGQWAFNDFFFFDGVGYLLLAGVCLTRTKWLIPIWLTLGAFSDPRVVIAVPLIYVLQGRTAIENLSLRSLLRIDPRRAATLAGVALFLILRAILGLQMGRMLDRSQVGLYRLVPNLLTCPLDLALVFKGTLLIALAGLGLLALLRKWEAVGILLLASAPCILASLLVSDLSRSLGYLFPLVFVCVRLLYESVSAPALRRFAVCAALLSVLIPTSYVWEDGLKTYAALPVVGLQHLLGLVHR